MTSLISSRLGVDASAICLIPQTAQISPKEQRTVLRRLHPNVFCNKKIDFIQSISPYVMILFLYFNYSRIDRHFDEICKGESGAETSLISESAKVALIFGFYLLCAKTAEFLTDQFDLYRINKIIDIDPRFQNLVLLLPSPIEQKLVTNSSLLKENIERAHLVFKKIDEMGIYIRNNPLRNNKMGYCKKKDYEWVSTVNKLRAAYSSDLKIYAAEIEKAKTGHCEECAILIKVYAEKMFPDMGVDLFMIKGGDHLFPVIGRKTQTEKRGLFNPESVVCDYWTGAIFPATEAQERLLACTGLRASTPGPYPVVQKFNPNLYEVVKSP